MRELAKLLVISILFLINSTSVLQTSSEESVKIIVTFSSLKPDVEQLICTGDQVEAIVPSNVDPHSYELRPSDVLKIKEADLIISTGHTYFEREIEELAREGEIRGEVIVIPKIPGIRLKLNPVTGQFNMHMPIYDPNNYKVFLMYLKNKLKTINPKCSEVYEKKTRDIINKVNELIEKVPKFKKKALAVSPLAQYAIEWLNVEIEGILLKEREAPLTPQDIVKFERKVSSQKVDLIIIVEDDPLQAREKVKEMAENYNIPILLIPSPLRYNTIPEKLNEIINRMANLVRSTSVKNRFAYFSPVLIMIIIIILLTIILLLFLRRKY